MYWAQFLQRSPITGEIIEASGDRAVIIQDGRESESTRRAIAQRECKARGYCGYQLMRGETFTRSAALAPPEIFIY